MRLDARQKQEAVPGGADATARLDDRHLAQIFLRLRSPATLARAAFACRRWRRVAFSPAFLRQYRRLHPPQVVGFFICNGGYRLRRVGGERPVLEISDPTFLPFLVDGVPRYELDHESAYIGAALITVDDDGAGSSATTVSFEVLLVSYFMYGPRLCVFSSRTGQWSVLPEARFMNKFVMPMLGGVGDPAHANGRVYWVMDDDSEAYLMVLDTRIKEFSTVRLLASMCKQYDGNMRVMRTEDGELFIVAMLIGGLALHLWHLDRSRSTKGRWVRERVVELAYFHGVMELFAGGHGGRIRIMDAGEGIVFLKNYSSWVFAVSIESRKVLRLPHEEFSSGPALPYRMALSPPLPRQAQGFTSNLLVLL
ncbi:hypothetical protein BRADI_3g08270v3 [Brachypodium distachyon]|uniref:Uncharacterized protein n=1 Tax=Brachypodium distachyon TaxID=15368 RepID=A0A0Q3F3N8_BRADI|nr:hypothetical protein BRADI_3g08270v3 [Brachypodium distachyon]